jgi:hypothetical protein
MGLLSWLKKTAARETDDALSGAAIARHLRRASRGSRL